MKTTTLVLVSALLLGGAAAAGRRATRASSLAPGDRYSYMLCKGVPMPSNVQGHHMLERLDCTVWSQLEDLRAAASPATPDPDFSASMLADLSSMPAVAPGVTAQFMACYMAESNVRAASRLDTGSMVSMEDATCTEWRDTMPAAVETAATASGAGDTTTAASTLGQSTGNLSFKRLRAHLKTDPLAATPSATAVGRPVKLVTGGK